MPDFNLDIEYTLSSVLRHQTTPPEHLLKDNDDATKISTAHFNI